MGVETEKRHEGRVVLGWRYEELVRAGYSEREAMLVADRADVDLHRAIALIESGCPPKTAVRILSDMRIRIDDPRLLPELVAFLDRRVHLIVSAESDVRGRGERARLCSRTAAAPSSTPSCTRFRAEHPDAETAIETAARRGAISATSSRSGCSRFPKPRTSPRARELDAPRPRVRRRGRGTALWIYVRLGERQAEVVPGRLRARGLRPHRPRARPLGASR